MDNVWRFLLLILLGVMLLLPGLVLSLEMREKDMEGTYDAEKASCVLASLHDDSLFLKSLGGGIGSRIAMDEERLAEKVRELYGEELRGFIVVTEGYVRVDSGQGLGPPRFYREVDGNECTWYRREGTVCFRVGPEEGYEECEAGDRDASVYACEDAMGLERTVMRAGLRIFLSQEVVLPWMGSQKAWKKQRECRIFLN